MYSCVRIIDFPSLGNCETGHIWTDERLAVHGAYIVSTVKQLINGFQRTHMD
jgi:hypothetical protein